MAVKWTRNLVLSVIHEARKAGQIEAERKLAELLGNGAKYNVTDGEKLVGKMLDVCGFASLKISARGKFFQLAKKLSDEENIGLHNCWRFSCVNAYRGGGALSIFDSTFRQEMSVNIAACVGQAKVLNAYGIETTIQSRMD